MNDTSVVKEMIKKTKKTGHSARTVCIYDDGINILARRLENETKYDKNKTNANRGGL